MSNPYGITLDDASLRWASAEGVPESVIAAICLLSESSVDEIVARLAPAELEQVIKIVGRSPRGYPPGAYAALKAKRDLALPAPPTQSLSPATRSDVGANHLIRRHTRTLAGLSPPAARAGLAQRPHR